jgi:pentatricopeptide repeat protein
LRVCGSAATTGKGRLFHDQIIRYGLELDVSIGNALIDMYMKCGSIKEGEKLFSSINRDLISWSSMIAGYTQHGNGLMALKCFEKLPVGFVLNTVIYSCALKACGSIGALMEGRLLYDEILRSKLELDVGLANHLVDMYVNCRSLGEAVRMLTSWPKRDIVSWGILIGGYAECKDVHGALQLLEKMWQQDGLRPDRVIFISIIQACSNIDSAEQGKVIHDLMVRDGLKLDIAVGSTLVDMYAKSKNLDEAFNVHKSLPYRDVTSWGILVSGYSQHGHPHLALECFEKMLKDDVEPDNHVFSSALKSCATASALQTGRLLHLQIVKRGRKIDAVIGGSLVDMYGKCGNLWEGWETLNSMDPQDVIAWNTLISGYAQHCEYILAQECLQAMQSQGLKPDSTTYVSILAACSHAGMVDDGYWYFTSMARDRITPNVEHFNCMIDLVGRSGYLNDAQKLLRSMPIVTNSTAWTSLLAACRKFGHLNLAQECFDEIMRLDPDNAAAFILMLNCYADFGMWKHVQNLCKSQKSRSTITWKHGMLWIECDDL